MEIENTDDSSENQTKSENVLVEDNMVDSERTHNRYKITILLLITYNCS
jgi:hypothetical protein